MNRIRGITLIEILVVIAILTILCAIALPLFSKQFPARSFGGQVTVELPAGHKLVSVTWKEKELWYLIRPMRPGELPETNQFLEKSVLGRLEGRVIFKESKKDLAEAP